MQKFKILISIIILALIAIFLFRFEEQLKKEIVANDKKIIEASHNIAIKNIEAAVSSYYFIVTATKAYTKSLDSPPTAEQLQNYILDYTQKVGYKDSILLSFLDTNHQFVYTVGPKQLDPVGISGFNVSWFRSDREIQILDSMMRVKTISLSQPINLVEGWPAFPFSFNLTYQEDVIYGYIAAVLNVKYLTNQVYNSTHDARTFHRFIVNDSIDFTGTAVYDNSTIYNNLYDSLYYKNQDLIDSDFTYSSYDLFGHQFTIGTALIESNSTLRFINFIFEAYLLFALIIIYLIWKLSRKRSVREST